MIEIYKKQLNDKPNRNRTGLKSPELMGLDSSAQEMMNIKLSQEEYTEDPDMNIDTTNKSKEYNAYIFIDQLKKIYKEPKKKTKK